MPEIVEADMPQAFHFQQLAEIGGNASGVEDIAHGIHKNIAVILFAVAISAYAPILLLLLPQRQQLFPDVADQRQGAQAGFRLGTVGADDFTFAVYLCVGYNVLNGDGVRGRFTLSYDLTFLDLLLCSLYEGESELSTGCSRCPVHPLQNVYDYLEPKPTEKNR